MHIRLGTEADLPQAVALILELAEHEQSLHELELSTEELIRDGSGQNPRFNFLVAVEEEEVVGLAVIFETYSTWKGRMLYLEDLVIKQSHRCRGIGRALLQEVQNEAIARGINRVQWQAHDYNTAALNFYQSLGANLNHSWVNCSLTIQENR